jgi:hypothetical protein
MAQATASFQAGRKLLAVTKAQEPEKKV